MLLKPHAKLPAYLRHGKLKIQNFCRHSADMEENANKLHFVVFNFVNDPQILIFFPMLITNKIFHVTVPLLNYFCDQFVTPEICHSRRHCSVCQQINMVFSDGDKILIKHTNTLRIYSYTCR